MFDILKWPYKSLIYQSINTVVNFVAFFIDKWWKYGRIEKIEKSILNRFFSSGESINRFFEKSIFLPALVKTSIKLWLVSYQLLLRTLFSKYSFSKYERTFVLKGFILVVSTVFWESDCERVLKFGFLAT